MGFKKFKKFKKFKMIMKKFLFISIIACLAAACSDVKDLDAGYEDVFSNDGPPQIACVYDVISDSNWVAPITDGVLNQYIRITGKNLAKPTKVIVDGLDVDIPHRVYARNEECYLRIPRYVPDSQDGKLVYETDYGKVTIDFSVGVPAVELTGLVNEFILPGNSAQLSGDYFDLYNFGDTTETSPVNITAVNEELGYNEVLKCDSCTETYTSVKIPEDCPDNTLITFQYQNMEKETVVKTIKYRPTENLLYGNFDGDLGWWNDDGKAMVTDGTNDGDPASLGFNFLRFNKTIDSWAWWSTGFGSEFPLELTSLSELKNYVMKFEVCTSASCPFYSYTDDNTGYDHAGYEFTLMGCASRYQFNPVGDQGLSNTNGKWVTYRIPLADMMKGLEEVPAKGAWCNFEFVCQPNNDDGWTVDHSFGQFRIEPAEY